MTPRPFTEHYPDPRAVEPVSAATIAKRLGVTPQCVYNWRRRGLIEPVSWADKRALYDWETVKAWWMARRAS